MIRNDTYKDKSPEFDTEEDARDFVIEQGWVIV